MDYLLKLIIEINWLIFSFVCCGTLIFHSDLVILLDEVWFFFKLCCGFENFLEIFFQLEVWYISAICFLGSVLESERPSNSVLKIQFWFCWFYGSCSSFIFCIYCVLLRSYFCWILCYLFCGSAICVWRSERPLVSVLKTQSSTFFFNILYMNYLNLGDYLGSMIAVAAVFHLKFCILFSVFYWACA